MKCPYSSNLAKTHTASTIFIHSTDKSYEPPTTCDTLI